MHPIYRIMLRTWLFFRFLPKPSLYWQLIPAAFVIGWLGLRSLGVAEEAAFVFSGVFVWFTHLWLSTPNAFSRYEARVPGNLRPILALYFLFIVMLMLQVWWLDPDFTQRVLTGHLAFYGLVLLWAASGDRKILDAVIPMATNEPPFDAFRIHFTQVKALTLILANVINETLIIIDAPLGARVGVLALMPLTLFYTLHIMLRLTVRDSDLAED